MTKSQIVAKIKEKAIAFHNTKLGKATEIVVGIFIVLVILAKIF